MSSSISSLLEPESRDALRQILESRTFRRSEALRRFLEFVCELELAGRRAEISEYNIATQALNRPSDFSSDVDSSVRTRAHALRQKLDEYYRSEGRESPVRIELPKGSYVPVVTKTTEPETQAPPVAVEELDFPTLPQPRSWPVFFAGAALTAALLPILFATNWLDWGVRVKTPAVLRSLWGPLLVGDRVVVCVGQPLQLWVREYGLNPLPSQYPPFADPAPSSPAFARYYESNVGQSPPKGLVLHPSPNAPLWGDVSGAAMAGRFLADNGVDFEILPERTIRGKYAIRNSSALIFGRPEFSPLVAQHLARGYTVRYMPEIRRHAIVLQSDSRKRFLNSEQTDAQNYGLVTVITERSGDPRRTIVFSGITSDGSQAGVEFVTRAATVERLRTALKRDGIGDWPDQFQVVIRTTSSNGYPLKVDYETHLVLP